MTRSVECEIASSHALLSKTKNRLCEEFATLAEG